MVDRDALVRALTLRIRGGDITAVAILADALEEVGDQRAARLRAIHRDWLAVREDAWLRGPGNVTRRRYRVKSLAYLRGHIYQLRRRALQVLGERVTWAWMKATDWAVDAWQEIRRERGDVAQETHDDPGAGTHPHSA